MAIPQAGMPLSKITAAALDDTGYVVDATKVTLHPHVVHCEHQAVYLVVNIAVCRVTVSRDDDVICKYMVHRCAHVWLISGK